MKKSTSILPSAILCLLFASCDLLGLGGSSGNPPDPSLRSLTTAPETVVVDDDRIVLRTFMWRDFQPISPPDGKPLIAIFRVVTVDSAEMPPGLQPVDAWIVHDGEVWPLRFSDQETPPGERQPYQHYRVARDGPKLGPDVYVDAVIRLVDANGRFSYLKAAHQYIMRTD